MLFSHKNCKIRGYIPIREDIIIKRNFSAPQIVVFSFAALILIGAILLTLPISSVSGESLNFLDALFTATSAVCVTGLVVMQTASSWTLFGKLVILILIQIGALGMLTFMMLGLKLLKQRVSLRTNLVIGTQFNQTHPGGMRELVSHIVRVTFIIEALGAILLASGFFFSGFTDLPHAIFYGIFHSISAFCNAGFDLIGGNSLTPLANNLFISTTISLLIISGSLGFPVWAELIKLYKTPTLSIKTRLRRLTLHSKLVITTTFALLFLGMFAFLLFEFNNPLTLQNMPFSEKLSSAWFQSVTLRTAGFNTISQAGLRDVSKIFSCMLMLIGGSPAGTAGGLKTVTVAVLAAAVISAIKGEKIISSYHRTLPLYTLQKALTVIFTMTLVVAFSTTALTFTEVGVDYIDLLFEVCSAAGTVGVTTGITSDLSVLGKLIIMGCMFIGRLSPVTLAVALNIKSKSFVGGKKFADGYVIIG
ncbi:MAG: TrkH family potassium uptake protein [Lactovum sp.]